MNNRGVSVVTLVITIIILILVTSVTVYNGMNMVSRTRERATNDRLMTIATSIVAHEKELGYGKVVLGGDKASYGLININGTKDNPSDDLLISGDKTIALSGDAYVQIGIDDYKIMGLQDYADTENIPPTFLVKAPKYDNENEKVYILRTPIYVKKSGIYTEEDFMYYVYTVFDKESRNNYKMEFDDIKGVNKPLLTDDMIPVIARFSKDDFDRVNPTIVEDVYKDNWYNYSKEAPMWANVMLKTSDSYNLANRYYVWIPRFAYKIQDFYKGTNYQEIPSAAVDIVFLREDTEYPANDDILSTGFQVHPAFRYKDGETGEEVNIPGFWISKEYVAAVDSLYGGSGSSSALSTVQLSRLHPNINGDGITSRLLKNSEWAAVAYLSMYYVGRTSNGNSLGNNASGVLNLDVETFVAAGLEGDIENHIPYADVYNVNEGKMTYWSYESSRNDSSLAYTYNNSQRKFGDGICCTSKNDGVDENGAWFGGTSIPISEETPYFLRGFDSNLFSYESTSNSGTTAVCRNVLIIENK